MNPDVRTYYSVRKFFGVPDGGVACSSALRTSLIKDNNSAVFNSHQLIRDTMGAEAGFQEFRNNELLLCSQPLSYMSAYSQSVLPKIPYEIIKQTRLNNFDYLSSKLASTNKMSLNMNAEFKCPMAYPYYSDNLELRKKLIQNKIYVPTYWPELLEVCETDSVEYHLAQKLLPLPIDQRYGEEDMQRIIDVILN